MSEISTRTYTLDDEQAFMANVEREIQEAEIVIVDGVLVKSRFPFPSMVVMVYADRIIYRWPTGVGDTIEERVVLR